MSLFDDLGRFLETRLEEFLKAHPELELQALDEKLRQQEADAVRMLAEGRAEQQRLQNSILATAEEIKTWHFRIDKAIKANRSDLAEGARAREADLLKQGNQLWGQMEGLKDRIQKMDQLLKQVQIKRQEVREQLQANRAQQRAAATNESWSKGWAQPSPSWEHLEKEFQNLEVEQELQRLRQKG